MKIMLDKGAKMPTRAHPYDAGLDLYAPRDVEIPASRCNGHGYDGSFSGFAYVGSAIIDTGVHVKIPEGCVGFIKSKSGLNVKHGIVSEGVIDSGYTGSIAVKLYNHGETDYYVHAGDKISQLVVLPFEHPYVEIVDELEQTGSRGESGFGSTGR